MVYSRPHLDALTALTVAMESSGQMKLMTSIALLVIRGAAPLAKALAAIDLLSGGRVIVGAGPGSSPKDYETVGVPFEERWKRFDELVPKLRGFWKDLEPRPVQDPIPIWIGSWGSEAGLRRTARLGDGWLASAYNKTPPSSARTSRSSCRFGRVGNVTRVPFPTESRRCSPMSPTSALSPMRS
jgi:alkanesulfonate monooxygenase SsuD/methylene tetrahydromethanopterin reductase-like flavin-dependent oxidoreductase (luciferase family)